MSRNVILLVVVAVVAGRVSIGLKGPGGVARGQTTTSTPVIQDNFDDNKQGTLWTVFGSGTSAKATEVNKRLEFTTTADANETLVGYIGNKWWIDPNQDFQMKVDLYFNVSRQSTGWVTFGLTPNSSTPKDRHVMFGIGRFTSFENYWWQLKEGYRTRTDFASRGWPSATLYISYDYWNDILYLSDIGYGKEEAWQILYDFVQNNWGRVPMYVFIGVTTENLGIASGSVYADNFVIDKGRIGSPYQSPDSNDPDNGGVIITDLVTTLSIVPSTIQRKASGDRITALVGLPKEIVLADWCSTDVPVLSPGGISAGVQGAFTWVDGTVKILASFSKTSFLEAVTRDGEMEVHITGKLKDGRTYAGDCTVTVE